jgi:hypothetical protein
MLSSDVKWKAMIKFPSDVMVKKEERERQDQGSKYSEHRPRLAEQVR